MTSECIRTHRGHRHQNRHRNRRNNSHINVNINSNIGGTNKTAAALAIHKAMCFSRMLLILLIITVAPVQATISFVESGKVFPSKVDPLIGQPLLRGYEYMGRLQAVSDNPTLCPGVYPQQKFDIVTPTDGLPVALVAQSGGCSLYDKVRVASSMISPSNTVGYLIVMDPIKKHKLMLSNESKSEDIATNENNNNNDLPTTIDIDIDVGIDVDEEDYESNALSFWETLELEFADIARAEENGRNLIQRSEEGDENASNTRPLNIGNVGVDVNIRVLHVSFRTGVALFNALAHQHPIDRRQGGSRIILNGKESNFQWKTVVTYMLIAMCVCACFCACVILCLHPNFEDEVEDHQAPRRPVRRRLTLDEVRTRFPSYHFGHDACHDAGCGSGTCEANAKIESESEAEAENGYMQLEDECTICLDEFVTGVRVRKLPCGHVFHSTCIARWLIERSAVCPLCKLDLYIEPVEEDDSDSSSTNNNANSLPQRGQFWSRWWNDVIANGTETGTEYTQPLLAVPSGAPSETGNALATEGGADEEPRSWWPFSMEIVTDPDEEMFVDDEHETNRQPTSASGSSPLSAVTSALSFWTMNVFGVGLRHRQRGSNNSNEDETHTNLTMTELTEPLVPQGSMEPELELEPEESPPEPAISPTGSTNSSNSNVNINGNSNSAVQPSTAQI